jgi:hypothetical protein
MIAKHQIHHNDNLSSFANSPTNILDALSVYTDKKKKPKRNRSAFILFSIDIRKKVDPEGLSSVNPNDKFVKIAEMWKNLPEKEKKLYEEKARLEKEQYTVDLSEFCKAYPSEPIQRPRNHIKKPCNAYGYFLKHVKDEIREKDPNLRMCEVLKIVGERWKNITPQQKQKFEEMAEVSRKHFKEEISKQTELQKKVKIDHYNSPSINVKVRTPESYSTELDDLVCKDSKMMDFDDHKENLNHLNIHSLTRKRSMTSTTDNKKNVPLMVNPLSNFNNQQNILNNFNAKSVQKDIVIPSLNNYPLSGLNFNTPYGALALQDLFWKVEQLRQNVFLQMANSKIPAVNNENYNQNVNANALLQLLSQTAMLNKLNQQKGSPLPY